MVTQYINCAILNSIIHTSVIAFSFSHMYDYRVVMGSSAFKRGNSLSMIEWVSDTVVGGHNLGLTHTHAGFNPTICKHRKTAEARELSLNYIYLLYNSSVIKTKTIAQFWIFFFFWLLPIRWGRRCELNSSTSLYLSKILSKLFSHKTSC